VSVIQPTYSLGCPYAYHFFNLEAVGCAPAVAGRRCISHGVSYNRYVKLISVALHGYKRFEQRSSMKVDGKLIAVVGPNESGKSSFLQALLHLNHSNRLSTSGGTWETTRYADVPADREVIKATYLLDENDKQALKDVHGGQDIRWCTVSKAVNGRHYYDLEPLPQRSLQPRRRAEQTLHEVSSRQGFRRMFAGTR
jgi:hypothetical protein